MLTSHILVTYFKVLSHLMMKIISLVSYSNVYSELCESNEHSAPYM